MGIPRQILAWFNRQRDQWRAAMHRAYQEKYAREVVAQVAIRRGMEPGGDLDRWMRENNVSITYTPTIAHGKVIDATITISHGLLRGDTEQPPTD